VAHAASEEASAPKRPVKVVELPKELVEKLLPLLPARAVLRARVVCRCGP